MNPTMTAWPRNPQIGPPVRADENRLRYMAQSILYGVVDDPLPDTAEQAQDVIDWHQQGASK